MPSSDDRRLFGRDPGGYASGRPGYPPEIYERLVERCGLAPGIPTVEIGPGPGQATAELLARGARPLIAIEPDEALASYLVEHFGERVEVVNSAFEDFDAAPASISLAVSATAWHWVDQEAGLRRIARLLEPGGWWAVWWTVFHDPWQPDSLYEALDPILGSMPSRSTPKGEVSAEAFALDHEARTADLLAAGAFRNIDVDHFWWKLKLDRSRARSLFGTFSRILTLPRSERERVLDRIEQVIETQFAGLAVRRCVTVLYTAQRT